jgi:four helix bundle protein
LDVASKFHDLVAYRLAAAIADELWGLVANWTPFDRWSIGMQLVRAADSVGANIAEATGRWHEPDKRRLLYVARGSLYETEHWLARAEARHLFPTEELAERLSELGRTLNGLLKRPG